MKKLLIFVSLLFITNILFISCGHQLTLKKRHYNNGYYVDYSNKRSSFKPAKYCQTSPAKPHPLFAAKQKAEAPLQQHNLNTGACAEDLTANAVTYNSFSVLAFKDKQHSGKAYTHKYFPAARPAIIPPETITKNEIRKDLLLKTPHESGRSLLWTLVVIILILWLIAILTGGWGLGSLINVLVVIALILLILWLLRVI